jgi:hypothetical protein
MRLPFLQVAMETIELAAPDVAVQLGVNLNEALGCLVRVFGWTLARCPEHLPPSHSAAIDGAYAHRLIANAAGFTGDPELFVAALCDCTPAVLARTDSGFRARGLDRYDAAWRKNHKAEWEAMSRSGSAAKPLPNRAVQALNSSDSAAKPGGSGAVQPPNRAVQAPQIQTQTHTQLEASLPREGLVDELAEVFKKERGSRYRGDPRDYEGLRRLEGEDHQEIITRWTRALRRTGFPTCATLAEFAKHWDHFAADQPRKSNPGDPRRAPIRAEDMKHGKVGDVEL